MTFPDLEPAYIGGQYCWSWIPAVFGECINREIWAKLRPDNKFSTYAAYNSKEAAFADLERATNLWNAEQRGTK